MYIYGWMLVCLYIYIHAQIYVSEYMYVCVSSDDRKR